MWSAPSCLGGRLQLLPSGRVGPATQALGMPGSDPLDRVMVPIEDGGDGGPAVSRPCRRYPNSLASYSSTRVCTMPRLMLGVVLGGKVVSYVSQRAGAAAVPCTVPDQQQWHLALIVALGTVLALANSAWYEGHQQHVVQPARRIFCIRECFE